MEMLKLQNMLNVDTNGEDWRSGVTMGGKIINWRRYMLTESVELIESFPYKHWKDLNKEPDYDNVKIELVDIWHFLMSELLVTHDNLEVLSEDLDTMYKMSFRQVPKEENGYEEQIKAIENFIRAIMDKYHNGLVILFFIIMHRVGLSIEELYKIYIGKNVLNGFRQDNGYKNGTYKKLWNGIEDNVVLTDILNNDKQYTAKELYIELHQRYNAL